MISFIKQYIDKVAILQIGAILLISAGYIQENDSLIQLGDLFFLACVLVGKPEDDIVSYALIVPFTGLMPVGGFRVYYCLWISAIKLIRKKTQGTNLLFIISFVYFAFNFLFFDLLLGGNNSLGTLYSLFVYVFLFCSRISCLNVNIEKLAIMTVISCMLILRLILLSSSSLDYYVDAENEQIKLGEEVREIGGAMGVSLYSSVGVAVSLVLALAKKGLYRILFIGAAAFFVIMALFALSRTFFTSVLVGAIFSICIAFYTGDKGALTNIFKTVLPLVFFMIVAYCLIMQFMGGELLTMVGKLEDLFSGGPGSRTRIWESVFNYLIDDPITLLFGAGTNRYSVMPSSTGYAYHGYGAHSLYLDVLMSFGIVGAILYYKVLRHLSLKIKNYSGTNSQHYVGTALMFLPIGIYLSSQLAQGSFRDTPTYIYPIVLLLITFGLLSNQTTKA